MPVAAFGLAAAFVTPMADLLPDSSGGSCVRIWHSSDQGGRGKAGRLCPGSSDVDLLGYGESVVDLNAEISDSALDFGMSQQQLHGT